MIEKLEGKKIISVVLVCQEEAIEENNEELDVLSEKIAKLHAWLFIQVGDDLFILARFGLSLASHV